MPDALLHIAVRVLSCLTARPPREPDLADVERLLQSLPSEELGLELDDLACQVIHRELERKKARAATG
jgi:hypothetical protein